MLALRHVIEGSFRPEPVSRGIWATIAAIALVVLLQSSESNAAVPLAIGLFGGSVLLFILSIRASRLRWHKDDTLAVSGAVVCLGLWFITGNPFVALLAILATDMMAFIPTYVKTWHHPLFEDEAFWFMLALASTLSFINLVQFQDVEISNVAYNAYFLFSQLLMGSIIVLRRHITARSARS